MYRQKMMIREYLKMIGRRILQHKLYAVINVIGLTVAFTAALLIYMHAMKEWKTDRFHRSADRIYRVTLKNQLRQDWVVHFAGPLAPHAKAEFPAIEDYVRVASWSLAVRKEGDEQFVPNKNCLKADKQFFEVFTFPLEVGEVKQDWGKDWAVITRREAKNYFGEANPIGKKIRLKEGWDPNGEGREYRIVAVMKDFPLSSSLQGDYVIDFSLDKDARQWGMLSFFTYFKLSKDADIAAIEKGIPVLLSRYEEYFEPDKYQYKLQPLKEIYMHSEHIVRDLPHGSWRLNLILGGVALLILLLAAGNYLMIAMALLHKQAAGIVMQRCLGADKRYLFWGVLGEIAGYAGVAFGISVLLVLLLHPGFIAIISPEMSYSLSVTLWEIGLFIGVIMLLMVGVGLILTGWINRHIDRHAVREILQHFSRRWDLKILLSLLQMCIFAALLACSVILNRQMGFVKNRNLGFDSRQVLNLYWRFDSNTDMESVRRDILNADPDIVECSNGHALPILFENPTFVYDENRPDLKVKTYELLGDAHYLPVYRIQLAAGRNIDLEKCPRRLEEFLGARGGRMPEVLVNEELARQLGKKEIVGSVLKMREDGYFSLQVVGMVKDFHFQPLHEKIQPMVLVYDMPTVIQSILVRYREGSRQKVIGHLQQLFEERFPGSQFSCLEYEFTQLYSQDLALVRMIHIFTLIAVLVGGMGIFAFSVFMAESRRKEVALRKINGADFRQIVLLLDRQFLGRILLACAIGLPVAHFIMTQWLRGFAYKTELTVGLYLGIICVCVVFVLLIVTWQIYRAARVNPVDVLKRE